ncbi:Antiseptic resistance protein [Photobacterium piscicola]|uniref:Antiseptic resistance protein n=1 Tax=Photobacterium piscicola TaxID=1378299 RepID=A0A1T5I120_9GAMM|nr:MFS transporter [Photobacterium piscicola]SKC32750.1 Antiseptic resistance protein [Photobacterium piscicola]
MENTSKLAPIDKAKTGMAKWFSLVILLMAQMGTMGDNSGLSVSTASLINELGASVSDIAFANAMYPLIAGACMIAGGMLGLIWGWKRLFQVGALLLCLAEIIAAYTDNIQIFIFVARSLSGFGASFLIPAVLGLIVGIYTDTKDRAIAFGAVAAAVGVANTAAPLVFGFLIDKFDYRVAFEALAIYFGMIFILGFALEKIEKPTVKIKFDFIGTILVSIGLLSVIVGLLKISEWGLITPLSPSFHILGISPTLPLVLFGIAILIVFIKWEHQFELKNGACLMPHIYKTPQLRDGLYMCGMVFFVLGAYILIGITYCQLVAGYSATDTAVLLMVFSMGMLITSLATPTKFAHVSCRKLCMVGIGFCVLASLSGALGTEIDSINKAFFASALFTGLGCGIIASQASLIVTAAVNQRDATQSGGVQATSRNIGQTIGIAVLGSVLMFSLTNMVKSDAANSDLISTQTKQQVEQISSIPFLSDKDFTQLVENNITEKKDYPVLVDINREARKSSAQLSWLVLAAMCFMSIFTLTKNIPNYSLINKS